MPENTQMSENIVSAPPGESWFSITRRFEAPPGLIWRCYTEPQHLARFWGPRDATTTSTVDLRVGGIWHTQWQYENGSSFGYTSVYLEIAEPRLLRYRDAPNGWSGGLDGLPPVDLLSAITLESKDNGTEVFVKVVCTSVAARDETVRRGFALMVGTGHDRLAEYLKTLDAET